ncbi:DNA mismatch repair protein MutS [Pedobacter sp. HMF7647]|uniref:DNA mismatch repair protein MutS n=1 Tax=Hufsiella arboris TaxID=2695275 RepID=A0A7K1Y809_9SPHI|nr:DNA mismatch repair protein MutS [Hufsiella arboris]MXV50188.1 DNA mismatch repair protein MutS [Hufsiella arboris]
MDASTEKYYRERIALAEDKIKKERKFVNGYSFLRLFMILAGIALTGLAIKHENILLTELAIIATFIAFAIVVRVQVTHIKLRDYHTTFRQVNENELNCLAGKANSYSCGAEFANDLHPYTSDLDIFGKKSLFALLNRCSTRGANLLLASWLRNPAEVNEVEKRQELVKVLASDGEWIQKFQATLISDEAEVDLNRLFSSLKAFPAGLDSCTAIFVKLSPLIFFISAALSFFFYQALIVLFITGLSNIFLVVYFLPRIAKASRITGKISSDMYRYSGAFMLMESNPAIAALLAKGLEGSGADSVTVSKEVKRLAAISARLDVGAIPLIGPLLNIFMAWNVRHFSTLAKWVEENKGLLPEAFAVLAETEALLSLSVLYRNHPDWVFPTVVSQSPAMTAVQLGHPLIRDNVRVYNDFSLGDTGHIDIITGSNMAGKSTFLRTIGINAVLALAGAPVCARSMQLSSFQVFTYMRIKDSVNDDISTFKAELNRLKYLFQYISENQHVYFLIDEMLRGTNSADKYRGSKAIIEKLISMQGIGMVATHDLEISRLEATHEGYVRNYYFDIQVDNDDMYFDYKLKHGICKTFNASLLLKNIGININKIV